jgi:hypothetical protein
MKRLFACAFLIGLLTCVGCFTSAPPTQVVEPEAVAAAEPAGPPPLTADQVNIPNAKQKAQELDEEMERAQKRLLLKTPY